MFIRLPGWRLPGARPRPVWGGWFLLTLFLLSACATGAPRGGLLVGYRYKPLTPTTFNHQGVDVADPSPGGYKLY